MRALAVLGRLAAVVLGTWAVLALVLALPTLLPQSWQYYIYSPASVALGMLAVIVAPVALVAAKAPWIRTGHNRRQAAHPHPVFGRRR